MADANFCPHCGAKINRPQSANQINKNQLSRFSIYVLSATFFLAILIIILILNSNLKNIETKLFLKEQQNQTAMSGEFPANHPDMEKMKHIQEIKDQLKQNPTDTDLMIHLANNYFDIGRFDLAKVYYQKAVNNNVKTPEVYIDLGVSYFNLSQLDSALVFVNEALKLNPAHRLGLFNKGVIEFNLKKYEAAIATWQKLIQTHPESQEANTAKQFIEDAKKMLSKS